MYWDKIPNKKLHLPCKSKNSCLYKSQESVEQINETKLCVCVSLQRNAHADNFLLLITFQFVIEYFKHWMVSVQCKLISNI